MSIPACFSTTTSMEGFSYCFLFIVLNRFNCLYELFSLQRYNIFYKPPNISSKNYEYEYIHKRTPPCVNIPEIPLSRYSVIPSFRHSDIPSFRHFVIQAPCRYPVLPTSRHSGIPKKRHVIFLVPLHAG
jgi:hypothetical protein